MWAALALSTLVTWVPAQTGELGVENVRVTDSVLGPPRKDPEHVLPGDVFVLSFDMVNLKMEPNGEIRYRVGMSLSKDGKVQFEGEPQDYVSTNSLGGARVPVTSMAVIGTDTQPGELTMTVTVTDRLANKKKTIERKFEVMPMQFGIVRVGRTNVPEAQQGLISMPAIAVPGQSMLLHFTIVGYALDSKTEYPDLEISTIITDEEGKPTLEKPATARLKRTREDWKKGKYHVCQYEINLNRSGKFKVAVKATDKTNDKTAEYSFNLTVMDIK